MWCVSVCICVCVCVYSHSTVYGITQLSVCGVCMYVCTHVVLYTEPHGRQYVVRVCIMCVYACTHIVLYTEPHRRQGIVVRVVRHFSVNLVRHLGSNLLTQLKQESRALLASCFLLLEMAFKILSLLCNLINFNGIKSYRTLGDFIFRHKSTAVTDSFAKNNVLRELGSPKCTV